MVYIILWLLGVPLILIILLWLVGIGRYSSQRAEDNDGRHSPHAG
jgi:hypothetical protein